MKLVTRRALLGTGAAAIAACVAFALPPVRRSICGSPEEQYRLFAQAEIGRACVACDAHLTPALVAEWVAEVDQGEVQNLVGADFAAGNVTEVDGWMLSRTETYQYAAAFYALA